jgi:hypothetical protein
VHDGGVRVTEGVSVSHGDDRFAHRGCHTTTGRRPVTVPPYEFAKNGTGVALSDVAYDGQHVLYLSDTAANTIYRVDLAQRNAISVFVSDPSLAGPRGLAVHPKTGRLIVTSWHKGKIIEVAHDGAIIDLVSNSFFSSRFHNLDGVDFDSWGNMYVSDFTAGKVWRMRPDRRFDVYSRRSACMDLAPLRWSDHNLVHPGPPRRLCGPRLPDKRQASVRVDVMPAAAGLGRWRPPAVADRLAAQSE